MDRFFSNIIIVIIIVVVAVAINTPAAPPGLPSRTGCGAPVRQPAGSRLQPVPADARAAEPGVLAAHAPPARVHVYELTAPVHSNIRTEQAILHDN